MTTTRPPTLADVAARADVSLKTASRVVNGEPYVREDTRRRVLAAATSLGYSPNASASALARGVDSSVVGLITGDLTNPFYAAVASGVESALRDRGLQLTISSSDEAPERERAIATEFARRHVRALLVVSSLDDHGFYTTLQERGVPVVFLDRAAQGLRAPSVVLDDEQGAALAARHLLGHGHRTFAFIGDYPTLPTYRSRLAGFADALRSRGVPPEALAVSKGAHDVATAEKATLALLDSAEPPSAIFASNNRVTVGALRALAEHPSPPALVGFDDFDLADVLGVTVVAHDPVEMGRRAAELALDRDGSVETLRLPTRLIARGSGERTP